jgi:nucleoid-associated protein YgaU
VAVLASGVVMFGNYHRMKEMEAVIASVLPAGTTAYKNSDEVEIEEISGEVYPTRERSISSGTDSDKSAWDAGAEGIIIGGNMTAGDSEDMPAVSGNASDATSAADGAGRPSETMKESEAVSAPVETVTYIVREGETLYGICLNQYQNLTMIPEICRLNGLEDENRISVGQKLLLPAEGLSSAQ